MQYINLNISVLQYGHLMKVKFLEYLGTSTFGSQPLD